MSVFSGSVRGLAVAGAAAALLLSGVFSPTANAAGEPTMTINPAEWVAFGEDVTMTGTQCLAPDNGTAEVLIPFGEGFTVTPDASGSWSWTHAADWGYGNAGGIEVYCVKYEDSQADAEIGVVETMALEVSPATFAYAPFDYAVVASRVMPGGMTGVDSAVESYGFVPGETVTYTLTGNGVDMVVGTGVADADGTVKTTILVPDTVVIGEYTLTVTGTSGRTYSSIVTVGNEPPAEDGGSTVGGSKPGSMPDLGTDVI